MQELENWAVEVEDWAVEDWAVGNPAVGNPAVGNRVYTDKTRLRGLNKRR
ncbi:MULTISPECIES: hypothetical protein [unclassified Microcoleus]|nr:MULTISPECIES: hypothetical protein [unclassified Microcoleus]MCC3437732.1 hypothetical protein [Microcoleus sp. PH2017_05_CCC_O_A]MCC3585956.1 hypothetical protein [Microcoleus sp. PH2017_30_WIL_O_A]